MARLILDTNVLVNFWRSKRIEDQTDETAIRSLAQKLTELTGSKVIVSPVYLEMVVGTKSSQELDKTRIFLSEFLVLDNWELKPEDLRRARQLAERIGPDSKTRHLGDCLIKAIAIRFSYEVRSGDPFFRQPG